MQENQGARVSPCELELEVARLTRELVEARAQQAASVDQQTATSEILRVISLSPTSTQPVFETIVGNAVSLCGSLFANVFRYDGEMLHFVAACNVGADYVDLLKAKYPMRPNDSQVAGRVIQTRSVVHLEDVLADPNYDQRFPSAMGWRRMLGVPMLRRGEPLGVIVVGWAEAGPVPPVQIDLLKTFADQAVIAIENARLFQEVQSRNHALTELLEQQTATSDVLNAISRSTFELQPVLDTIVATASRLCQAEYAVVWRLHEGTYHPAAANNAEADFIKHASQHPLPPERGSLVGRTAVERKTVHIHDCLADPEYTSFEYQAIGKYRTMLGVPLLRDGAAIGVIGLMRNAMLPFTDKQIELVTTFADQAVIAIENARLFEEVQARTREVTESLEQQTAASEILKVIARSPTDVQPVFETIATSAAQLCAARYCIVFGFDGELVHFAAEHGLPPEAVAGNRKAYPMAPGRESAAARAILSRTVEQIPDVEVDPDYAHTSIARRGKVRSLLAVPMLKDDVPAGAIVVARPQVGVFPQRDIDLLKTFADQAIIALENVRLFDEVQARSAELGEALQQQTATADVLKVISRSAFDLKLVLQTLVESAARLCDADIVTITRQIDGVFYDAESYGLPPELMELVRTMPITPDRGMVAGRALLEGRIIQVADVRADPEYTFSPTIQKLAGFRTLLGVPMMREGVPIGVLTPGRREVRPFTEKQIELLQTFADQAVIAIENVRLFEEVQSKTRDLEEALTFQKATSSVLEVIGRSASNLQPVFDVILDTAADLCHADMSVLRLMREGELQHVASSRRNDPVVVQHARENPILPADRSSVAGRVALAGHTIHIPDVAQDTEYTFYRTLDTPIGSVLGVPLVQDGKVAGVIALLRRVAQPFTQRQIELVETFADQAVIAIENVRLFQEVQARTAELGESLQQQTATADVLKVISRSAFDLQTVLDTLVESAVRLCRADKGSLERIVDGGFQYQSLFGFPPDFRAYGNAHPTEIGRGSAVGRAAAEKRIVHIHDTLADHEYTHHNVAQAGGMRTVLAVPLLREDTLIGVFAMIRGEMLPFAEKEIELVKTFADQAVIAIENARLFDEVQSRTRELSRSLDDLRTAQDRLVQTEKLASLGQLTAGIAHEIKNPLNFVNNFSSLSAELIDELRESLAKVLVEDKVRDEMAELTGLLKSNLEKVVEHGRRADSIVKNMLLHSRSGSGEHRPSDINAIVEESLNLAYHGARAEKQGFSITMEKSLDPMAGEVDLFPQEITRVLLNLISNGFYATTKRKAQADGGYQPLLTASTRNLGNSVEIRIRDNGTGIPPEVKEKMFNPFFTTKPAGEGTGLGLSLSHDIIVKQHAGTIEVETEPGAFTELRIVLPRGAASLAKSGGDA